MKYDRYLNKSNVNDNLDIGLLTSANRAAELYNNNVIVEAKILSAMQTYSRAVGIQNELQSNVASLFFSNEINLNIYDTLNKQVNLLNNYNSILDKNNITELENIYNHIKKQNKIIKKQYDTLELDYKIDDSKILYLNESDNYYNTISVYLFIFYFICYIFLIYILIVVRKDMSNYFKSAILLFFLAYPFLLRIINTAFSNSWTFSDIYIFKILLKWVDYFFRTIKEVFINLWGLYNFYIVKNLSKIIHSI